MCLKEKNYTMVLAEGGVVRQGGRGLESPLNCRSRKKVKME